jgi:hypothetical protein
LQEETATAAGRDRATGHARADSADYRNAFPDFGRRSGDVELAYDRRDERHD